MHNLYMQKMQLLFSCNEVLLAYEDGATISDQNWEDVREGLSALNLPAENIMFPLIEKLRAGEGAAYPELKKYFTRFLDAQAIASADSARISEDYLAGTYGSDREFAGYVNYLRQETAHGLYDTVLNGLRKVQAENPDYYRLITAESKGWYFESNWLDGLEGSNNSLITNRIAVLKNNLDQLIWLYNNLADALSRRSLNAAIKYWLTWDYTDWRNIAQYSQEVVNTSIFPFYDDEVFVDCGSYIGDTVAEYVTAVNRDYARVYTYDISSASIELITKNLAALPNIDIRHKGTGEVNTKMNMYGSDKAFHGNKLSENGSGVPIDTVDVVRLDDDITEPVSFLKIDCEGMDKETLRGAQRIVKTYHPKLHIDSYHRLIDMIAVPRLIREIDPSYALYLRLICGINTPPRFPILAYMAV